MSSDQGKDNSVLSNHFALLYTIKQVKSFIRLDIVSLLVCWSQFIECSESGSCVTMILSEWLHVTRPEPEL